ncbi:MAG: tandem-95 repeat protein [Anaerolineae bacterium]|nr:tandem-95 repeat protein [Anaerolineae bacterium]
MNKSIVKTLFNDKLMLSSLIIGIIAAVTIGTVWAVSPGDLDTSFSSDGVLFTDVAGTGAKDMAYGVAVEATTGKVVAVGESGGDFAVARYNSDGSLDTTFSGDGLVVTAVSANVDMALDVVIEPDGQIVAVGHEEDAGGNPIAFVAVRYNENGSLDTSFGTNGIFSDALGGSLAQATAVALQSDGKIIIAGTVDDDFAVARLNATNGTLDSTFNSIGYNTTDIATRADEAQDVLIQTSGAIVLGGTAEDPGGDHQDFALARYTSTGLLDSTFGSGGRTRQDISRNPSLKINDIAYALGEQSDGKLVLAGIVETADVTNVTDIGLARFSANGSLDASFGTNGTVITPQAGADWAYDLAVQPTDKIIVVGYANDQDPNAATNTKENFQMLRYHAGGGLDTTFAASGYVITDIGTVVGAGNAKSQDQAYAVALYNDKIVVAGQTDVPLASGDANFALARYESHNTPPTLSPVNKTGDEDDDLLFSRTDFSNSFTDVNGDTLSKVKITSLPTNGVLKHGGNTVSINDEIAAASLNNLTFTPTANWFGTTSFTWNGTDGLAYAVVDAVVNITINNINDVPSFTLKTNPDQTISEDAGAQSVTNFVTSYDAGPNEGAQTIDFLVSNNNIVLFSGQPAIDGSGKLTFTPAANRFGSATVSVRVHDDGGTDNGGEDTSAAQTFTITINAVNDAPSFDNAGNVSANEDAGATTIPAWATNITEGPYEDQTISFSASTDSPLLITGLEVKETSGDLLFTPAPDLFGTAVVTVTLSDNGGGDNTSAPAVFNIVINPVNDAPSFTKGDDDTVLEDAGAQSIPGWATGMSVGPANENSQTWQFNISTDNDALFSALPAVAANGNLTYTPAANANGSATVTVVMQDSGGTAFGGEDTSSGQTFVISVTAVNDEPAFTNGGDVVVDEEFAALGSTISGWADPVSAGPPDESGQTLTFDISTNNDAMFTELPSINLTNGDLTFTAVGGGSDTAVITVSLSDNGGTANGGDDTSAVETFDITVTFINDAPTFTLGADQTVAEDAAAQTVTGFAADIDPGSPTETGQQLTFSTINDNSALFSAQPSIDSSSGDLMFTPAPDMNGSATITVTLSDDGGTANGGKDTSVPQTFMITVTPVNDLPTVTDGAVQGVPNETLLFKAADFERVFSDIDGDTLTTVKIVSLPNNGELLLNGTAVNLNQEIPAASLAMLTFVPDTDWSGTATFSWNGSDGTGYAAAAADMVITIKFMVYLPIILGG